MSTIDTELLRLAGRARLQDATISGFLRAQRDPNVISLAGGLPATEMLPVDEMAACIANVLKQHGSEALQYGLTEGVFELRQWIASRLQEKHGLGYSPDDILIVNGSQQALDLIARALIDPGDSIIIEDPCYIGAIQAFNAYEPSYVVAESDDEGLIPESLERLLRERRGPMPKFLYLVPNFSNPTGITLARDRRAQIVDICKNFGVLIVEDDPYGELRFEASKISPLACDSQEVVIYCGSASKIISPGLRIGWVATKHPGVLGSLIRGKVASDIHSNSLAQHVLLSYVADSTRLDEHIEGIRALYKRRCATMLDAIRSFTREVHVVEPEGGLFLWVSMRDVDTTSAFEKARAAGVLYVPGELFSPVHKKRNSMRLNFSNVSEDNIVEGMRRLLLAVAEN